MHGIISACMILRCSVMIQKHWIKDGTDGKAFQEQCGREELLLV